MRWRQPPLRQKLSCMFGSPVKSREMGLKAAVMAAACFLGAAHAMAEKTVHIAGIGAARCRTFLEAVGSNPQEERTYFAWAQGFMSGILIGAPSGVDEGINLLHPSFPLQQQADFVRAFCSGNPQAAYSDGVLELYRELRRRSSL